MKKINRIVKKGLYSMFGYDNIMVSQGLKGL